MGKVKELEVEIPEYNRDTHRWDWEKKEVVALTPEELAEIARRKRKADLEKRFGLILCDFNYFKAFDREIVQDKNGNSFELSYKELVDKWDRDNLDDFEQKVLKLEAAKKEMDDEAAKNKPIEDRRKEYAKIDHLFLEALAEGGGMIVDGVEKPSEKMQAYLKLRDEIKARFPK